MTPRIGDRVICTKGDQFISEGDTGLIVNVAPARYNLPARARVLWDSECVSMISATDFEIVPKGDISDNDARDVG